MSLATAGDAELHAAVTRLAAIDRPSASAGEREAAEWIAQRLRALGADVRIEEERVHGGYFAPMGVPSAVGALAGLAVLRGRRAAGALAGAAAIAISQDLQGGPTRWLRDLLPQRPTWNVVARAGSPRAGHTLVLHAHHDAARTSFIFDQTVPRLIASGCPGCTTCSTAGRRSWAPS